MQKATTIQKPRKTLFKKRDKKTIAKAKVTKFASSFYAQYGEVMSRLSHE